MRLNFWISRYLWVFLLFTSACSQSGSALPTLVPSAAVPTNTPSPTPTFEIHSSIEALVNRVAGSQVSSGSLYVERYTEYKGQAYPDGRLGYDVDFVVAAPDTPTRSDMLQMAYTLAHEFYYNFTDKKVMFLTLHLRGDEEDPTCVFGLGIGYRNVPQFLPEEQPVNLESWFNDLVTSRYYGDLPGETEALLAYGNDPTSVPDCRLSEWKGE